MSKRLTAKEKAANAEKKAAAKAAGVSASDDLSLLEGTPHTVEFDHSYENSEPIMAPNPNKPSQMLYTGHDKQVITTEHKSINYPNRQLSEQFKANHEANKNHGVTNVKITQTK